MSLLGTLTTGVSALRGFTTSLNVIGNDIANINTSGYKGSNVSFTDTFSGLGTRVGGTRTNTTQGALTSTGNPTDLGISGEGYFIVKDTASSASYATRDGGFRFDSTGYLVNQQGLRVQGLTGGSSGSAPGTLGDIKLGTPPSGTQLQSVTIDTSGNVIEAYANGTRATTNQVLMQKFTDPTQLSSQGNNLLSNLQAAGPLTSTLGAANAPGQGGLGTVQGGTLEQSNVDLTKEFADLITMQRAFQANSRVVTVSDTILDDMVNLKTH